MEKKKKIVVEPLNFPLHSESEIRTQTVLTDGITKNVKRNVNFWETNQISTAYVDVCGFEKIDFFDTLKQLTIKFLLK